MLYICSLTEVKNQAFPGYPLSILVYFPAGGMTDTSIKIINSSGHMTDIRYNHPLEDVFTYGYKKKIF